MRYLLATDGSPSSLRAAEWISRHRPGDGRSLPQLFLVFVFPTPPPTDLYAGIVDFPADPADARVRSVAERVFEVTRSMLGDFPGPIEEILLTGNPAKEILELAAVQHVELIVLGTRGHTTSADLCLGSTSNAVVHRALCPVLIVR